MCKFLTAESKLPSKSLKPPELPEKIPKEHDLSVMVATALYVEKLQKH